MVEASEMIAGLSKRLTRLKAEETACQEQLASLREKIAYIQGTLAILSEESATRSVPLTGVVHVYSQGPITAIGQVKEDNPPGLRPEEWRRRLQGLTQYQMLVTLAQGSDGVVRSAEATHLLFALGKARGNKRNTNKHLYHLLESSEDFERIAPGTFRLKSVELSHEDAENVSSDA
jgi:hypothetical protein